MVALSGLTLLVIVCQCGMLTLVLVCLGVRAECNWAKSSQQAASLLFCVLCCAFAICICDLMRQLHLRNSNVSSGEGHASLCPECGFN